MDCIVKVAEIVQYISITIVSVVGIFGIDRWRKEILYKKYSELSEETRMAIYKIVDIIKEIRSPFSHENEGVTRAKREGESDSEREVLNRAFIVFERMNKYHDEIARIKTLDYQHKAVFGKDATKGLEKIIGIIKQIQLSGVMLSKLWLEQNHISSFDEERRGKYLNELHKWEDIFWQTSESDKLSIDLENVVTEILSKDYLGRIDRGKHPKH